MNLEKFIPVAAGMAGGSSDAAAAFVGVNRLFGLGLSEEELMKRAVKVGADVPYCVMRGTALAEGIGEKLTRLPRVPHCYVLVGKSPMNDTDTASRRAEIARLNATTSRLQTELSTLLAEGEQIKVGALLIPSLVAVALMGGSATVACLFFIGL